MREIVITATQLQAAIESTAKALQSQRIPASLDRFDRAFHHFLTSQSMRWLLLDALLPLGLGVYALVQLWPIR
jgi:hypothetical protein